MIGGAADLASGVPIPRLVPIIKALRPLMDSLPGLQPNGSRPARNAATHSTANPPALSRVTSVNFSSFASIRGNGAPPVPSLNSPSNPTHQVASQYAGTI